MTITTAAAMARAEAEAAKAKKAFAKEESELKIQQAQLEASLESLRLEKRVAAIQAIQARPYQGNSHANSQMSDVVKFIARCELVSTSLTQFNDRPETFRAWRASFMNATKDLNLSPSKEMDLLVKWLGCESAEHAKQIRAVHINHPLQGLSLTRDRLYKTYGSPEMVESALFGKLESFPKISNRDNHRLRDLGNLLMEILAAKQDDDLAGLSYLDTPRGVNPIIQKLPFSLQEKWLTVGSSTKRTTEFPFHPSSS